MVEMLGALWTGQCCFRFSFRPCKQADSVARCPRVGGLSKGLLLGHSGAGRPVLNLPGHKIDFDLYFDRPLLKGSFCWVCPISTTSLPIRCSSNRMIRSLGTDKQPRLSH